MSKAAVIFFALLSGAAGDLFVGTCFEWALCDADKNQTVPGNVISPAVIGQNVAKIVVWQNGREVRAIEDLPRVEVVSLDAQELTTVPGLKNLPKLRSLHLRKNRLRRVQKRDFSATELRDVFLASNEISSIDEASFGPNVEFVDLSCNDLASFRPGWFGNPRVLKTLRLGANRLGSLPVGAFRNFPELKHLDLSRNFLRTIESGAVSGTRHFKDLNLAFNELGGLDSGAFEEGGVFIERFDLGHNKLTTLPAKLWERIVVSEGSIEGNPWECPLFRKLLVKWCNWEEEELEDSKCKTGTEMLAAVENSRETERSTFCASKQ